MPELKNPPILEKNFISDVINRWKNLGTDIDAKGLLKRALEGSFPLFFTLSLPRRNGVEGLPFWKVEIRVSVGKPRKEGVWRDADVDEQIMVMSDILFKEISFINSPSLRRRFDQESWQFNEFWITSQWDNSGRFRVKLSLNEMEFADSITPQVTIGDLFIRKEALEEYENLNKIGLDNSKKDRPLKGLSLEKRLAAFKTYIPDQDAYQDLGSPTKSFVWEYLKQRNPDLFKTGSDELFKKQKLISFVSGQREK